MGRSGNGSSTQQSSSHVSSTVRFGMINGKGQDQSLSHECQSKENEIPDSS